MVKAIIFDFDGVILESLEIKTNAFKKLYKSYGKEIVDKVAMHHLENGGVSRYEKFKIYHNQFLDIDLSMTNLQELSNKFSRIVMNEIIHVPFVKGAKEFIKKYHKKYFLFISSATPAGELTLICQKRKLSKYFKGIFGSPDPKTGHISHILDNWPIKKHEVVFIGDSASDRYAAKNQEINFIFRVTGAVENSINEMYTMDNLHELDSLILMINNKNSSIN